MITFKEMGLKPRSIALTGDKIKITKILNRPISVLDYKIVDSKFPPKNANDYNKCLHMQIMMNDVVYVTFCASKHLADLIEQVKENFSFPFSTTIVEEGEAYLFT